jgi:hypothetical protein
VGGPPATCTGSCPPSTLTLNDSTVVGNTVDAGAGSEGGAIWGSPNDRLAVQNSIVFSNSPQPELFGFGSAAPAISFSDVCNEAGGPAVPGKTSHNICADPKLDAGGAETAASPTLDAGSNALVPSGVTTDLAGNARIRENLSGCSRTTPPAIVDMGAFEFTARQIPPPCPPPPPFLVLSVGHLTDKHGKATVKIVCTRVAVSFCDGTVEVDTVKRFAAIDSVKRKRHVLVLGKRHFHVRSGHSSRVTIKLSSKVLRRFRGRRSVGIKVSASAHDRSRARVAIAKTASLKLPVTRHRR